jgi:subtilisin family serine protease
MKLRNFLIPVSIAVQSLSIQAQEAAPDNWFNLDFEQDKVRGVSTEKAYKELLKGKKSTSIIVSIIDSGVDEEHEDLKEVMWVNKDEIAGNGIDDDKNGYIDDIHGWNFIGGKDGKNINQDQLEVTRLYVYLKDKKRNKKEEAQFKTIKEEIDKKIGQAQQSVKYFETIISSLDIIDEVMGEQPLTMNNLRAVKVADDDKKTKTAIRTYKNMLYPRFEVEDTDTVEIDDIKNQFQGAADYYNGQAKYYYNAEFDPRSEIVGDDYMNSKEKNYGNNDVTGPDAQHGTHVAGIVAAKRNNNLGMNGVADNVQIMSVRAVPDGDERDKDVANAIYYSVNNGAKIINMSFGKGYKFDKKTVDKAVKYAEKKGVLLVHAAGNSSLNTDEESNYPNKYCKDKKSRKPFSNWIEVGALSWMPGEDAVATFSNYGKVNVDVFAPGVDIYATIPGSEYESLSGTSMASPVTAGVAALVWSYYPGLTVKELRKCIVESTIKMNDYVGLPGSNGAKKVEFKDLCNTSGVVNAYNALQMADKIMSAKK